MTASYERLLEEFYTSDRKKLEHLIESNAIQILEDANMRNLLSCFIDRLDRGSNFETNAMKAVKYFEVLSTINTINDLHAALDEVEKFCTKSRDQISSQVVDESTLNEFLHEEKRKTYHDIDDSDEFSRFKDYLRQKYQSSSSRRRRRHHHHHHH